MQVEEFNFPKFKDYESGKQVRFLQAKLDGYLAKIYINDSGRPHIFTKNDKDITEKVLKIAKIRNALDKVPVQSQLFGELHAFGVPATSIVTLINDADPRLDLTVFAAPIIHDLDMTDTSILSIYDCLKDYGLKTPFTIDLGSQQLISSAYQNELLEEAIEKKWEGWVLKSGHMDGWYKLKPVKTVDGFVIGTQISTSDSYAGGLKGVVIGVFREDGSIRKLGTAGNGFKKPFVMQFMSQEQINAKREEYIQQCQEKGKEPEPEKLAWYDLPRLEFDSLLNKVYEIGYDSIPLPGGKLRWPRVIRERDDKDMAACTEDQLEDCGSY
jgi:hypothetical protein